MTGASAVTAVLDSLAADLLAGPDGGTDGGVATPPAGAAIGVRCGGVTAHAVAGARDATGTPLTIATHHDLASVTKVVATTTSLLVLASRSDLALDDPVRRFVPQFSGGAKDGVTIRHLLAHRGGLAEWSPLYMVAADHPAAIERAATLDLRYRPGAQRAYSDLGFILLGGVIEAVAATELARAVAELVTAPLGLRATRFGRPAADADVAQGAFDDRIERRMLDTDEPYPVPYTSADFGGWRRGPVIGTVADGNAYHACGGCAGHAGLFSTVDDLLAWGAALAAREPAAGGWSAAMAAQFFASTDDASQALGFRRYPVALPDDRDVVVLGHPGYVGCAAGFVPGRDIVVALATNRLLTRGTPRSTEAMFRTVLEAVIPAVAR